MTPPPPQKKEAGFAKKSVVILLFITNVCVRARTQTQGRIHVSYTSHGSLGKLLQHALHTHEAFLNILPIKLNEIEWSYLIINSVSLVADLARM